MKTYFCQPGRTIMGRLERGDDLLRSLTELCREQNVQMGTVEAIGAVERATISAYEQDQQRYHDIVLERPLELASLQGNISAKDGELFLHCHVVLSDDDGQSWGGHLIEGTPVFACEFIVQELVGSTVPQRESDPATGLWLWAR